MAGRPLTMAKRLAELEERAFQLCVGIEKMRPAQYAARDEDGDELARWWNEAVRTVGRASIAVNTLLGRIEAKAGLDAETLGRERDLRRGWVENVAETVGS